jgi:hypothetical protein
MHIRERRCSVIGQSFLENIRFGLRQRPKVSEQFIRCQDLAVFINTLAAFVARSAFSIFAFQDAGWLAE